jgi:membrane-associated phospholipid phosphatase
VKGKRLLFFLLLVVAGHGAQAQPATEPPPFCEEPGRRTATIDTRGLGLVYCASTPLLVRPLQGAHASARPIFYGAVPLAWGGALLLRRDDDYSDAYRLTVTQGLTYGLVLGVKHAVGRPRPYVRRALSSRSTHYKASRRADAYTSFPSGHAALSAALVTSWGLSHPQWYVWGPGSVWAVGVSLSRLHLGVHYPTDVLVGMGVGVGVAVLVHQLRGALTPGIVDGRGGSLLTAPPPIGIQLRF